MGIGVLVSETMRLNKAKASCPVSVRGSSTAFVIRRDQLARPTTYSGTLAPGPADNSFDLENELTGRWATGPPLPSRLNCCPRVAFAEVVQDAVTHPSGGLAPSAEPG